MGTSHAKHPAADADISDADAIYTVLCGDLAAMSVLRRRHDAALRRVGLASLHNAEDAENAIERTYEKAMRSLGLFSSDAAFANWLISLMIGECVVERGSDDEPYWPFDP